MRSVVMRLVVVLVLGASVVTIFYQQARINRLAAEVARLQEQVQRQILLRDEGSAGDEPERKYDSPSNAVASLSGEQSRELLRLRGQVAVLRRQLAEALADLKQAKHQLPPQQAVAATEADLNDEQRKKLAEFTIGLKTGNSVSDLPRMKDGLERWDELFPVSRAPENSKLLAIMKERLKERIAELEGESKP